MTADDFWLTTHTNYELEEVEAQCSGQGCGWTWSMYGLTFGDLRKAIEQHIAEKH